ncbi:OB-fold protein [Intestinibacter sp.]
MGKEKVCKYCGEKLTNNNYVCLKCGKDQRGFVKKNPTLSVFLIVFILICISIGIIFIKVNSITKNSHSGEYIGLEDFMSDFGSDISITTDELIEEYENDKDDADLNYNENFLELTGKVKKIEEVDKRTIKVELKTDKNSDYKIYCSFDKDENDHYDEIKDYTNGKEITMTGNLIREGKNLNIEYCILGDWETYYAFDNTFNIDLDLEDLLEEAKKNDKNIKLDKKNIMSFDSDILDYGYSYEEIINHISQISAGEIIITDINEKSGLKDRTVTMKINEKEINIKLDKDNFCFDENLVYQINKVLKESNSDKMLYYAYMDYDDDFGIVNIAYSTQDDINKINKILNKSNLGISQFEKEAELESI